MASDGLAVVYFALTINQMVRTPPSLNRHQSAIVEMRISTKPERAAPMNKLSVVGLDLAKHVFQVHGVDCVHIPAHHEHSFRFNVNTDSG
jgi:hypothetical protein